MLNNRLLGLYRQLLRQTKQIKEVNKQQSHAAEIKKIFREEIYNSSEGSINVDKLIAFSESKLGYLKVVSSDRPRNFDSSGKKRFIMVNGKLVEGSIASEMRAVKTSLDPDDLSKHKYLLERQHFKHRR